MSCSGKSFVSVNWGNGNSYSTGIPTINRYALSRAIPDYAKTYQQTAIPRQTQYQRMLISNPVINYGIESRTNYAGYTKNPNITEQNVNFVNKNEITETLTDHLIGELEAKIQRSRNGSTEISAINE